MRVLVCGGRRYNDQPKLNSALDQAHAELTFTVVIEGEQSGADLLAKQWAESRGIAVNGYKAEWFRLGKAAGPIRNARMLNEGKPDLVIAFPGHNGTKDMINRAEAHGIPVRRIV